MNNNPNNLNKWRQPISSTMDPSKDWIRNVGVGTSKRSKNRYNFPAQYQNTPTRFSAKETLPAKNIVDEAVNALQNVQISNDIPKRSQKIRNFEEKETPMAPKQDKPEQDETKAVKSKEQCYKESSSCGKHLHSVYMDDEALNEFMKSGLIQFINGKFVYKKPPT